MALAADSKSLYIPISTIYGNPSADGTYTLNALDVKNLNDNLYAIAKKVQGGLTTSDLTSAAVDELHAGTVISNTTITNNLYATYGDIAELTVDRLITTDKVERYKASDTSILNYIWIENQAIKLMAGTTTGATVQHTDRNGALLYWCTAEQLGMSTTETAFPVLVYAYTELCKSEYAYFFDGINDVPRIVFGAGSDVEGHPEYGKGFIWKDADGLTVEYITPTGEITPITLTDFVDAKMRRLTSCAINKASGQVSVTMEGKSTPVTLAYAETTTSMTFTWPDGHTATVAIS